MKQVTNYSLVCFLWLIAAMSPLAAQVRSAALAKKHSQNIVRYEQTASLSGPNDVVFGPEIGTSVSFFTIINNCNTWSASGVPSWLTVSLSGNLTVTIDCSQNNTNSARTANLVMTGCGMTVQITVTQSARLFVYSEAAENLARDIFVGGNCLDVRNVTFSGAGSIGRFINGQTNIGFGSGVILTTGNLDVAPGPNDLDGASAGGGGTGSGAVGYDNNLATIGTGPMFDLAILEFDFTPTQPSFSFQYVFASEEYCEYVNTNFNDVFGIFITGPGISGTQNLAVVPMTTTPITINSINHVTNAGLYTPNTPFGLDNCEGGGICNCLPPQPVAMGFAAQELQYDGFTKNLTATTQVIPCETYHIKIAIADVGDGIWDSALFLKAGVNAGATASVDWLVNGVPGVDETVEGCSTVGLLIDRLSSDNTLPLPVSFSIGGTATNGSDYGPLASTYVIPAGASQIIIPVPILNDMIPEAEETVILTLNNACSCLQPQRILTIREQVTLELVADTVTICGAGVVDLSADATGGTTPYTYLWSTGSTEPVLSIFVSASSNYTVTVTDACGKTVSAIARANVTSPPTAQLLPPAPQLCPGQPGKILVNFTGAAPFTFSYQLNGTPQAPITGITSSPYMLFINQPGVYQGNSVTDVNGCHGPSSGALLVSNSTLSLSGVTSNASCPNTADGAINTTVTGGQGPYQYVWSGPSAIGNIPDPVNILPGSYALTLTDIFGCAQTQTFQVSASLCQWVVSPTGRNHTIILPSTLTSDAEMPLQTGDWIGAFYDSLGMLKCAGYGIWSGSNSAFAIYGNDAAPPAKNGFNTGEVFRIKVLRQALGQEFDATAQYAPIGTLGLVTHTNAFADDGISMISAISTALKHPLSNGWNMISSYIMPANPDMLEVFSPIASSIDIVKDGDGISMIPAFLVNNIGDWDIRAGYQVKANQKDTLRMVGQRVIPQDTPIPLKPGWQIIGYLRDHPQRIDTVFKSIKNQIILVKDNAGKVYSPQFGINTIVDMQPCQGYKVNAASNVILTYLPNFAAPADDRSESHQPADMGHFVLDENLNTGNNATIILTTDKAWNQIQPGDEIAVFTSAGLLCGKSTYRNENLAITVWGDDPSTGALVEGMKPGEAYHFKLWRKAEQLEYTLLTTLQSRARAYQPDAIESIDFVQLDDTVEKAELAAVGVHSLQVYPNPASESLNVLIKSTTAGRADLTLIGMDGKPVMRFEGLTYSAVDAVYTLPVHNKLAAGMYWLRFQFETGVVNRLVCIKNH